MQVTDESMMVATFKGHGSTAEVCIDRHVAFLREYFLISEILKTYDRPLV